MENSIYVPNTQWIDSPLFSLKGVTIPPGGTQLGPYDVTQFRSALLLFQNLSGNMYVQVKSTFPGAAGYSQVTFQQKIWSQFYGAINIPTYASTITIILGSLDAGNITADVALHPNNLDPGYRSTNQYHQLAAIQGLNLAASQSQVFLLPPYAGRCHYAFFCTVAGVSFELREVNANQTVIAFVVLAESIAASTPVQGDAVVGSGLHLLLIANGASASIADAAIYGDYAQQGSF